MRWNNGTALYNATANKIEKTENGDRNAKRTYKRKGDPHGKTHISTHIVSSPEGRVSRESSLFTHFFLAKGGIGAIIRICGCQKGGHTYAYAQTELFL